MIFNSVRITCTWFLMDVIKVSVRKLWLICLLVLVPWVHVNRCMTQQTQMMKSSSYMHVDLFLIAISQTMSSYFVYNICFTLIYFYITMDIVNNVWYILISLTVSHNNTHHIIIAQSWITVMKCNFIQIKY